MRSDMHPLHGLQDWPKSKWIDEIRKCRAKELVILEQFVLSTKDAGGSVSIDREDDMSIERAAAWIKNKIAEPLEERNWNHILRFQNKRLNDALHRNDDSLSGDPADTKIGYLENSLCTTALFRREFPLGVSSDIYASKRTRWKFALDNSGLSESKHPNNSAITCMLYSMIAFIVIGGVGFLLMYMVGTPDLWDLTEGTVQDMSDPTYSEKLNKRTKDRGTVASILASLTFSLTVNASIDAVGRIDPSTSTVMIGMLLGGTWGFVLDNMLGSDEGFREYKWSSASGMTYGIGSLGTSRYARYLITIIFDMFFTVILFKVLYVRVVRLAGFSARGREWIANGLCSFVISFLTYQTRFEWAYPSGIEDVRNQWISGQSMILFTVIMSMVYLVTESRTRIGEKGINDPPIKLLVVIMTFLGLFGLQLFGVVDPSILHTVNATNVAEVDIFDVHRPLRGVCATKALFYRGALVLTGVIVLSIGFVVFVTSKQTLSELRNMFRCTDRTRSASGAKVSPATSSDVTTMTDATDRMHGKIALFLIYNFLTLLIVLFFTYVPFYSEGGVRNTESWEDVCDRADPDELASMGL
eukprot:g1604.t1